MLGCKCTHLHACAPKAPAQAQAASPCLLPFWPGSFPAAGPASTLCALLSAVCSARACRQCRNCSTKAKPEALPSLTCMRHSPGTVLQGNDTVRFGARAPGQGGQQAGRSGVSGLHPPVPAGRGAALAGLHCESLSQSIAKFRAQTPIPHGCRTWYACQLILQGLRMSTGAVWEALRGSPLGSLQLRWEGSCMSM